MAEPIKLDDLTIFNAMSMREVMLKAMQEGKTEFDLSDVGEIDSSGLQLLMALNKTAKQSNQQLVFHSISEPVKELVNQYGLEQLVGMEA